MKSFVAFFCENWEFKQAWTFLGLKGSEREVAEAFTSVDKNNSGLIDIDEFKNTIKNERMAELSLTTVLEKMGVNIANANGAFDAFKATAQRRRIMKKTYEDNVITGSTTTKRGRPESL